MLLRKNIYTIAWAIFILVLSFMPTDSFPKQEHDFADDIVHFGFYAVLSFFLLRGLVQQYQYPKLRLRANQIAIIASTSFGGLIEIFQPIISDRFADYWDFLANFIGCIGGVFFYRYIIKT